MTIRHLLVHLDKSEASAIRADVAITLAKRFQAKLTALYAVCDPDVPGLASRNRYVFVEREAGKAEAAFRLHAANRGIDVDWRADIGANDVQVSRAVVLRAREMDLGGAGSVRSRLGRWHRAGSADRADRPAFRPAGAGRSPQRSLRETRPPDRRRLERQPRSEPRRARCAPSAGAGRGGDGIGDDARCRAHALLPPCPSIPTLW